MLPGYHKTHNVHALKAVIKSVEVPLASIGVGEGETLAPIDMIVKYPNVLKPVITPEPGSQSYEYTQIDGFSNPISEDDFPKSNSLGDVIGGWGY